MRHEIFDARLFASKISYSHCESVSSSSLSQHHHNDCTLTEWELYFLILLESMIVKNYL